uniref:HilA/EilA family virulence transcriptional regulator n=1 Tax=Yersinia frederiksenii TaxID=29484 RepID=UPI001F4C096A|nr:HilA/EilA family virulence transcriptional regulator [Yersinia frederiksenii]ULG19994.1 invasion protein [Yersinia frederiksenii]
MKTSGEKNAFRQYIFDDFVLQNDGILLHHNKEIHIPPKELEVFLLLLDAGGKIVTKEQIFEKVWTRNIASDESLTRCIYALRRILRRGKHCDYIGTVYGKGYHFKTQVAIVQSLKDQEKPSTTVAIFPFKMAPVMDDSLLHHSLVQGLSKYACFGLNILPVTVTQECNDFYAITNLMDQMQPEYYFTGKVVSHGSSWKLFIELVHAKDHKLLEHQSLEFEPSMHLSVLLTKMISMLIEKVPNFQLKNGELQHMTSLDTALACLTGRREMYNFTPLSLQHALSLFEECVSTQPQHSLPYCCLAECYISLAQLGLYDQQLAIDIAMKAIDKAIELDPGNSQALAILGLLSGLKGESSVASVLFKQAHLLMPDSSDVYYYHSLFHFLTGDLTKALEYIKYCIYLDQNRIGAGILMLWITYYLSTIDDAIVLANQLMTQNVANHPVLQGMMALFMALKGENGKAEVYLSKIELEQNLGYLAVNSIYTNYLLYGKDVKSDIISFLQQADLNKIRGSLLPLVLIVYGRKELEHYWQQLRLENNVWSNIWSQDPRLLGFQKLINAEEVA